MIKTFTDSSVKDRRVLLRLDLNVPVVDGKVTDTTRIDRLKPTLDALIHGGARKILILSHFGRPKGKADPAASLSFLPPVLSAQWGLPVGFGEDSAERITLLENIRFHEGEEANDPSFAKSLAVKGDVYINDAFSCAHRAHASTEGITHFLPSYAGLAMAAELHALSQVLESPQRPVMAIVGGSKISTKLSVLNNLVQKVDILALGGGMANTFLLAQGQDMGQSLTEPDMVNEARTIMAQAEKAGCKILLPMDSIIVSDLKDGADADITTYPAFPKDKRSVDAGPDSIRAVCAALDQCRTLLWNGPFGVFEIKPFDHATNSVARYAAQKTAAGTLITVAGGGDTASAMENAGVADDFTYVSTAGGAFLEWLEGKTLPGIAALEKAALKAA